MSSKFSMKNAVRMYDTDSAGILYFGQIYRFANDAFETMMETCGISFYDTFQNGPFILVIVHSEADYKHMLHIGDHIQVHAWVSRLGNSSFEISYEVHRGDLLAGTVKTVHVSIDHKTKQKIALPETLKAHLITLQAH